MKHMHLTNPKDNANVRSKIDSVETYLYRHFNKDDELLYVGISLSAIKRFINHKQLKDWTKESVIMKVERFPDRKSALEAERQAIKSENPKYNVQHKIIEFQLGFIKGINDNDDNKYIVVNTDIKSPYLELNPEPNARTKVWDYMFNNMGSWNRITLLQTKAAKELGMARQHMNRVLRELEEKGFIAKDGKSQTNNIYMVDPERCWNGQSEDHQIGMKQFAELIRKRYEKKDSTKPNTNQPLTTG